MAAKRLVFALYDNPVKEDYLKMSPFKDWIIISNSSEDLANEVIYYLTHKREAEKKVTKSYDWVREQSWEKMVGLYFGLWNIN